MKYRARVFDRIVIEFGTDGQTGVIVGDWRRVRVWPHAHIKKHRKICKKCKAVATLSLYRVGTP
jgi:hypothetical protein